jgi:hypothetical protein
MAVGPMKASRLRSEHGIEAEPTSVSTPYGIPRAFELMCINDHNRYPSYQLSRIAKMKRDERRFGGGAGLQNACD